VIESDLPTFNNTDDLVLIANNGIAIDSVLYDSKWGIKGKSLERKKYFENSNDPSNWGASEATGTPTTINSIATYYDLALSDATLDPAGVKLIIENKGNIESLKGKIEILVNDILIKDLALSQIPPSSDIEVFVDFSIIEYEPKVGDKLEIIIQSDEDINIRNNRFDIFIPKSTKSGDVLINEIMYDVDDTQFEFIEIYNNSDVDIQISNWYLADELDLKNERYNQIVTNINLLPNEYAVIVCDEAVYDKVDESLWGNILFTKKKFNLNKTTDNINIYNENKLLIDSVVYLDTWHEDYLSSTKNISLEKIRPNLISSDESNWKSCTNPSGSTILASNSYNNNTSSENNISVTPNPFSPTSSTKPYVLIEYELPFDNALLDCDIYYPDGNLAFSIAQSKFVSSAGTLSWNGRDNDNKVLPIGPYVVMIEATDQD
ncbi:MAG: lamin tail domain-containing protein, partial [Candidatus Kapaibacterium sp.]